VSASTVTILFEGRPLTVRAGTSVAVALWEQGIRVLSRSPKYGRPRGLHCARGHCTSCLMRVDGVPNVRTCQTPVAEGLRVERQDAGALHARPLQWTLDTAGGLFPAGFYFKWFNRPALVSRLFLRSLRPVAGIGRLPDPSAWWREEASGDPPAARDLGRFDRVIVGGGPSGLRALAASDADERVLLVDDHPEPGGQRRPALALVARVLGPEMGGLTVLARAFRAVEAAAAAAADQPDERLALGARLAAAYHPDQLLLHDGDGPAWLRARRLDWTAGALDAPGLFAGNDLPGLFGPRAAYRLLAGDGMSVRGQRALVTGTGLDLWLAAALLHAQGARVAAAPGAGEGRAEIGAAVELGWQIHTGLRLASARGRRDALVLGFAGREDGGRLVELGCDLAVIAGRGKPAYDLIYQLGADLVLDPDRGGYVAPGRGDLAAVPLPGGLELCVAGEAAGADPAAVLAPPAEEEP
jgi:sarcosine oxidase subunit alpha